MIILHGRPTTKKNSSRVVRCGKLTKVLPSKAYEGYEEDCLWQLKSCREKYEGPVRIKVLYWMRDRRSWPDLVGLMQATADILEKAGVIDNDKNIVSWDGTHIVGVDRSKPRALIEIEKAV